MKRNRRQRKNLGGRRRGGSRRLRGNLAGRARSSLRGFRQASLLAVALTAFILLFFNELEAQTPEAEGTTEPVAVDTAPRSPVEATEQAVGHLRATWDAFGTAWPKLVIALLIILAGWAVTRVARAIIQRLIHRWRRSAAISALTGIAIWLLAIGLAVSVVAGDLRALVGSLGLIGLALSWALQTPIESFTGWLLNSFQGYYRVGDRVAVGEVFGDVVKIDFLTTTVWEIGSPQRPGFVSAEQPTGRLVTFPNSEVLAGTIVNLTRDFAYVWDELPVQVANESDLRLAMQVLTRVADELLGPLMATPAQHYAQILQQAGLMEPVADRPQVFASSAESWTDLSIRYLVPARERRKWKSELLLRVTEAFAQPEIATRVLPAYPRRQLQRISPEGAPVTWSPDAAADGAR
jgi:small-conductance mechanosensitive channel